MSVRRSLAWSYAGQLTSSVVLFGAWVLAARLLTPREVGVFAVAFAAASLINILAAIGTNAYVVREAVLENGQLETAFTVSACLYAGLAVVILAVSWPVAHFLGEPGTGEVLRVLAVRPLFLILEFRPAAMLQREMKFHAVGTTMMSSAAVSAGVMVGLIFAGYSYMSMAYAVVAGAAVSAIVYNLFGARHARFRLSLRGWRHVAAFGLRMLTISGLALFAQRVSDVIMGRLLGLAALGLFSRATQIHDLMFFNFYGAATRVALPKLAEDQRSRGTVGDAYLSWLDVLTAVMWPLSAGVSVLAGPVIYNLYGEAWIAAAAPLALLMVAQMVAVAFAMNWELFVLKNETARQTKMETIRATLSLSAFTTGCLFDMTAAAAGRIADCVAGFLLYRPHIRRLAEVEQYQIDRSYLRSGALTVAAVLPSVILMAYTGWSPKTSPFAIAVAVMLGVAAWLSLAAAMQHRIAAEVRRFAAAGLNRNRTANR